jgi:tyrosyl-tRNA synthetase
VKWENMTKSVMAKADGTHVLILIGDTNAKVNDLSIKLESIPYLERGRTIVPVSFLRDALKVEIEYDKTTNHVLITPKKD